MRPLVVVPAVAVNLPEPVAVFPDTAARKVQVSVQANVAKAAGELRLEVPAGWKAEPALAAVSRLRCPARQQRVTFEVTPPAGETTASAARRGEGGRPRDRVRHAGDRVSAYPAADAVPAADDQAGAVEYQGDGEARSATSWARATRCRTRCGNSGWMSRC